MSNSGSSTPRAFAAQVTSAEDLLKTQTVGLVNLDDYRKRRRDVADLQANNESLDSESAGGGNGADKNLKKKKKSRNTTGRKLLSFEDEEDETSASFYDKSKELGTKDVEDEVGHVNTLKRPLRANPNTDLPAPKAMTKAILAAEAIERERLRLEFVKVQEAVRNGEIAIPFVFYDGSNVPGGTVKVKKGEHIWLFLERCRKLGAEMGVSSEGSVEGGGTKERVDGKKSWARIGVDDLMMVRSNIIIPHHYEFYYFIANKIPDPSQPERLLFEYKGTEESISIEAEKPLLHVPKSHKIEGQDAEPTLTKVVDRRWYDKNKHIYPASLWREYKTGKDRDETKSGKRDAVGNAFFF